MNGWMGSVVNWLVGSQPSLPHQTEQLTLGRMSFSFFRTKRPSLSSLFQFSWTTRGFSSRSSWRSSNTQTHTQTDTPVHLRVNCVQWFLFPTIKHYLKIRLFWFSYVGQPLSLPRLLIDSLWDSPPLTWTSYREYFGEESILMSGLNFSASVSMTSCVVAVLDTLMHLVAKLPATRSWK